MMVPVLNLIVLLNRTFSNLHVRTWNFNKKILLRELKIIFFDALSLFEYPKSFC